MVMKIDYKEERNKTYEYYKTLKIVYCPYLKTNIVFNSNRKRDNTKKYINFAGNLEND